MFLLFGGRATSQIVKTLVCAKMEHIFLKLSPEFVDVVKAVVFLKIWGVLDLQLNLFHVSQFCSH